jgi:16S rRNA processing protein RimM
VRFDTVEDRDAALALKGSSLYIDRIIAEKTRKRYLDDDSFYYYDLIGCRAFVRGDILGDVIDVFEAGAGSVLVIRRPAGKDIMIPFVESMVDTARIAERRLDIDPVEGLFDI